MYYFVYIKKLGTNLVDKMVRIGYFGIDRFHFGIYGAALPKTESERLISIDLPTGGTS